jgi:hypothetical protein
MLNKEKNILSNRNIPINIVCGNDAIQLDSEQFIGEVVKGLMNGVSQLPIHPGFENHPYKGILENIDASKYIIGTFPPISYLIDTLQVNGHNIVKFLQPTHPFQTIPKPQIPFFHGNVSALWSVLLTSFELNELKSFLPLKRNEAKQYLIQKLISLDIYYDDIIFRTQRTLGKLGEPHKNLGYTYEDVNLKNICPDINLIQKVLDNQKLQVVCFTNGATFRSGENGGIQLYSQVNRQGLIKTGNSDALSIFLRTCQDLGLHIEMRCMPHFDWTALHLLQEQQKRTKLIFELRVTKTKKVTLPALQAFQQKKFTVITPYSPAAHGNIEVHPIVQSLRRVYGLNQTAAQLLPNIYTHFRNNNYQELFQFNINQ